MCSNNKTNMICGAANSPLLTLPAEIRNHIYRYAVVEANGTSTNVTADGLQEPGVLSACKLLRKEAASLFYAESTFEVQSRDYCCDSSCFWDAKCARVLTEFGLKKLSATWSAQLSPNWGNLIKWLRHFHEDRVIARFVGPIEARKTAGKEPPMYLDVRLVGRMFCTVNAMLDKRWEKVEKLLLEDREILGELDARWKA